MSVYQDWKSRVLGHSIGNGECVALVVNNPQAYIEALYPGVPWTQIIPPLAAPNDGAKFMAGKGNQYLQWIPNDHNNPNQVPVQGDVGVFDGTPAPGYTNQYNNPAGHTGVFDSASPAGYWLTNQQVGTLAATNFWPWKFRPCIGWYHPVSPGTTPPPNPAPAPAPVPGGRTIFLPPTTGPWHLYNVGGPYNPPQAKGILVPSQFGGLTYNILNDRGNGIYTIQSQMYGQGDLWTNGSDVVIK